MTGRALVEEGGKRGEKSRRERKGDRKKEGKRAGDRKNELGREREEGRDVVMKKRKKNECARPGEWRKRRKNVTEAVTCKIGEHGDGRGGGKEKEEEKEGNVTEAEMGREGAYEGERQETLLLHANGLTRR